MKFDKENIAVCVAGLVVLGAVFGSYAAGNYMGTQEGINKILSEQEAANETAHTDWASFGGGYYIIGAEVISTNNGTTTFEFISGTQVVSKLGEFDTDKVYMLTVFDEHTPEYMNDDTIVVVWEAK